MIKDVLMDCFEMWAVAWTANRCAVGVTSIALGVAGVSVASVTALPAILMAGGCGCISFAAMDIAENRIASKNQKFEELERLKNK